MEESPVNKNAINLLAYGGNGEVEVSVQRKDSGGKTGTGRRIQPQT